MLDATGAVESRANGRSACKSEDGQRSEIRDALAEWSCRVEPLARAMRAGGYSTYPDMCSYVDGARARRGVCVCVKASERDD